MLECLPVLHEWNILEDNDESIDSDVPKLSELGSLDHILSIVQFHTAPTSFKIPKEPMELFRLVRVADFLGADGFIDAAAGWLEVDRTRITNNNPIRPVFKLIRSAYRAAEHNLPSGCVVCRNKFETDGPRRIDVIVTSCCASLVHPACYPNEHSCIICHSVLRLLPCVVCGLPISSGGNIAKEYSEALPHRTPCCAADCHPGCKNGLSSCPLCSCPLLHVCNVWSVDNEFSTAGDIIFAWRAMQMNVATSERSRSANVTTKVAIVL